MKWTCIFILTFSFFPLLASMHNNPGQFSGSLSSSFSRGIDEVSEDVYNVNQLSFQYISENKLYFPSINFSYSRPVNSYATEENEGFGDITLNLSIKPRDKNIRFGLGSTFPFSESSQQKSLKAKTQLFLSTINPVYPRWSVFTDHRLILAFYKYNTADVYGFEPNRPFGFSNTIGVSFQTLVWWTTSLFYNLSLSNDYKGYTGKVNGLGFNQSIQFNSHFQLGLNFYWSDSQLAYDELFNFFSGTAEVSLAVSF